MLKNVKQTWGAVLPVEEGIYFFKNVRDSNKYIQINNIDNMDGDTIIELHNFHGYYEQRWEIIHVWNRYYKIISTYSDKALTAPTGANNDVVTQSSYTGELTQRWRFIEQSDGTYKISPESNSNFFMAAGNTSLFADQDLEIRTAQSDGGDKWEPVNLNMPVDIDVKVIFDHGYQSRYSDALTRIREELIALQDKYLEEFGIYVNFYSPTVYTSYADECSLPYNSHCNHGSCNNSILYTNGSTSLQPYHHKNIYNILLRVPFPDTSQNLKIFYMGHDNCYVDNLEDVPNPLFGIAYSNFGIAMIMNFGGQSQETKTMVHEFGHLFGAKDHYGNNTPTTEQMNDSADGGLYNDYCIYGKYKDLAFVCNELTICEGCRITITENKYRYGID